MAAFAIAVIMHIATNLLHSREDMRRCATRIAAVTGVNVIEALEAGDDKAAVKALQPCARSRGGRVEISLPDGRPLATYRRGAGRGAGGRAGSALQDPGAVQLPAPAGVRSPATSASRLQDGRVRITAAAVADGKVSGRGANHRAARCRLSRLARFLCSRPPPDWPRRCSAPIGSPRGCSSKYPGPS